MQWNYYMLHKAAFFPYSVLATYQRLVILDCKSRSSYLAMPICIRAKTFTKGKNEAIVIRLDGEGHSLGEIAKILYKKNDLYPHFPDKYYDGSNELCS